MKFLAGFLAFISSFFAGDSPPKPQPLNSSIIAFHETYFAPAVAEPGNFPFTKTVTIAAVENSEKEPTKPVTAPPPPPPALVLPPAPAPIAPLPPEDPYVLKTEPIVNWLSTNFSFKGTSSESDRTLPELTFDREYWRMEIFAYWAPDVIPPKPTLEKDYVKIEVYEAGTNKLIYTMVSGNDESIHKFQSFKKPGKYYFKTYSKSPSQWEMTFTVSSKIAQ